MEDPFGRRTQPLEALHDTRGRDPRGLARERADRPEDVRHATDVTGDVLLDEEPAPARFGEDRRHALLRRDRVHHARPLACRRALHDPLRAVGVRHGPHPLVARAVPRLAVAHERREVLDEIARVEVDRVLETDDDLREQVVGEALAPGPFRVTREEAVQVVVVLRVHVDGPLVEARPIEERDDDDGPPHFAWVERPAEPDRGFDAGVLGRVDPRGHEERRPGRRARESDVRPFVARETRVAGEREPPRRALAGGRDRDGSDHGRSLPEWRSAAFRRMPRSTAGSGCHPASRIATWPPSPSLPAVACTCSAAVTIRSWATSATAAFFPRGAKASSRCARTASPSRATGRSGAATTATTPFARSRRTASPRSRSGRAAARPTRATTARASARSRGAVRPSTGRRTSRSRRTATCTCPTATGTRGSTASRRAASSSRPGASPGPARARSCSRMASPCTGTAACSSAAASTTASRRAAPP